MMKSYKLHFLLASILALVAIGLFIWSFLNTQKLQSVINEERVVVDSLRNENEFSTKWIEADGIFLLTENYAEAKEAYNQLLENANKEDSLALTNRIKHIQQLQQKPKGDNVAQQYETIFKQNTAVIDSLKSIINLRSSNNSSRTDSLLRKIQSLSAEIATKNTALNKKQLIQVITFKNDNGRTVHYLGEVINEKANGGGVGIWNTGSIYRGDWKDNMRHGKGTFEWVDGEKYVGDYRNDKRDGEGKYYWPSGERYEGEWRDDRRQGFGILFDPDGNIRFEGSWKDDKLVK